MFTKDEIKRNLLGCLEFALLMPGADRLFGNGYRDAVKSLLIPVLLMPITMLVVCSFPSPAMAGKSQTVMALLYSLQFAVSWSLFMVCVYFLSKQFDRRERFCKFVTAANWLNVPAIVIFAPIIAMLMTGLHTYDELYPMMVILLIYTCVVSAFMAAQVLKLPWELGGFIAIVGMAIDDHTKQAMEFISGML